MSNKKYYKVVSKDLTSYLHHILPQKFVVQYKLNSWVEPNVVKTKLMVYNNKQRAREFCLWKVCPSSTKIYEVEVKNPQNKGIFVNISEFKKLDTKIHTLLKLQQQHKKFFNDEELYDTTFVDAVKLVKEIPFVQKDFTKYIRMYEKARGV